MRSGNIRAEAGGGASKAATMKISEQEAVTNLAPITQLQEEIFFKLQLAMDMAEEMTGGGGHKPIKTARSI